MSPTPSLRSAVQRLLPSRRTSFCSVYNSGEDATTTLVSSEVGERQRHRKAGFTAAHAEERSKCNPCENLWLYKKEFCVTFITHSKHGETSCDIVKQTEGEQGHKKRTKEAPNVQQMPSQIWTDNLVLNILKSTMEIRSMKLHEENKPCSMP